MDGQFSHNRSFNNLKMATTGNSPLPQDNDRSSGELRALDCNLTSLCDHIQVEGFNSGAFSDIVLQAMGSTYRLHRLILSRSSYFRNMLQGPWKEANAPMVTLQIDDHNVNAEAVEMALAYLYGQHPKLNDSNAFRVLAAASFLDLQDLCAICTDFIISELWTTNFLSYQVFAESQDYGIHGERVRNACWGYLCQSGMEELREVLPKLSSQTLHALLTSDELWVPSEEKRFELALYALLAKGALQKFEHPEQSSSLMESPTDPFVVKGKNLMDINTNKQLVETEAGSSGLHKKCEGNNILCELADCMVDFHIVEADTKHIHFQHESSSQTVPAAAYVCKMEDPASSSNSSSTMQVISSGAYVETNTGTERRNREGTAEKPHEQSKAAFLGENIVWFSRDHPRSCSSGLSPHNGVLSSEWGKSSLSQPPSWGGRIVGRREVKASAKDTYGIREEDYDAFINIFEGGSLLYCHMSFEGLLNARKQLEELGFPCKAVCDGLWLQVLLSQRVQEIGADTCNKCSFSSLSCICRQSYRYSQGVSPPTYYRQDHERNGTPSNMNDVYLADAQGEGSGLLRPVRVHVQAPMDGLAGIGRGDGLTALVGLSQGNNASPIQVEQSDRVYESDLQSRYSGVAAVVPFNTDIPREILEPEEPTAVVDWENSDGCSISLDLKTQLRKFPPFRFGVEFQDVHRLADGQVKHSPEVFYAGSLWKVSVQAFSDEDPQGRRTLGLFLHRRKAETSDPLRKGHLYVDSREKVTARYQLICPSKREVMVFGNFKQTGTLLPKAPKGWGWRTALLFDELPDLLQGGALRVASVVQLV
ncbi:uncharacterized protein LOC116254632 [Nymphaea colorata]|nr:uncharacterized protein LOC116254632 [Nymphaea colorata]